MEVTEYFANGDSRISSCGIYAAIVSRSDVVELKFEDCVGMHTLDLSNGNFPNLDKVRFPLTLKYLYIQNNNIKKADLRYLKNLKKLVISNNNISGDIKLPERLECLHIEHNKLTKLNFDLPNLSEVNARYNKITFLPNKLPTKLSVLSLSHNNIYEINYLPESVRMLDLSHNNISRFDILLKNLVYVKLNYNPILVIESHHNSLVKLDDDIQEKIEKYREIFAHIDLPNHSKNIVEKMLL